jgi:hypothetical protein
MTITPAGNASGSGSPIAFLGFVAFGGVMGPIVVYAISRGVRRSPTKTSDLNYF